MTEGRQRWARPTPGHGPTSWWPRWGPARPGVIGLLLAGAALPPVLRSRTGPRVRLVVATVVVLVPALALVACGATLLAGSGGGLYWLAAATVLGLGGATANAWVLLVEILR